MYSELYHTSKMKFLEKIVNGGKPLTNLSREISLVLIFVGLDLRQL